MLQQAATHLNVKDTLSFAVTSRTFHAAMGPHLDSALLASCIAHAPDFAALDVFMQPVRPGAPAPVDAKGRPATIAGLLPERQGEQQLAVSSRLAELLREPFQNQQSVISALDLARRIPIEHAGKAYEAIAPKLFLLREEGTRTETFNMILEVAGRQPSDIGSRVIGALASSLFVLPEHLRTATFDRILEGVSQQPSDVGWRITLGLCKSLKDLPSVERQHRYDALLPELAAARCIPIEHVGEVFVGIAPMVPVLSENMRTDAFDLILNGARQQPSDIGGRIIVGLRHTPMALPNSEERSTRMGALLRAAEGHSQIVRLQVTQTYHEVTRSLFDLS